MIAKRPAPPIVPPIVPQRPIARLGALLLAAALAGCVTAEGTGGPVTAASPAASSATGAGNARPAVAAPAPVEAPVEAQAPEVAALPALPRIEPGMLLTYSRERLVAELGEPVFSRVDKGAEILRFAGAGCVLDVFLFADGKDSPPRIAYLEARDGAGAPADRTACLNTIPRERTGPVAG